MKRNIARFLSVAVSVVLLVVLCVPAFASSGSQYEQKVTWWHWVTNVPFLKDIAGYTLGAVCTKSEDGYHHANSYQEDLQDGYYNCICSYCGHEFTAYESDLNQSYQNQVSTLPASGVSSDGKLFSRLNVQKFTYSSSGSASDFVTLSVGPEWSVSIKSDKVVYGVFSQFNAPVAGTYEVSVSSASDPAARFYPLTTYPNGCCYIGNGSDILSFSLLSRPTSYRVTGTTHKFERSVSLVQGEVLVPEGYYFGLLNYLSSNFVSVSGCFDVICTPVSPPGDTYNINTRPTTITGGNYGIVGDDNNITTVTNTTQIVNEGDNLYYNPATGQTQTITDWTYNYDGRIYDITLDTGDKVSVEYGDENITITENTINEGDTIVNNYTIYYMIDGSGSGESHTHEWYKTGERQATCLVPAQRTYTCSICGEQKTETDPVLGHSWHAIQTVTTQYDDDGNQTQEGYTIYECERCGEQYKSTNNTGPPPTGGGGSGGGTSENIFTGIFGLIWDFFTFLFDLFSEFVVGGIKGFISGLKDAGSSFFSILNPFDWGY